VHEVENGCHKPEGLIHGRRSVQYLSIVIGATFGGRWTTMGLRIRLHLGGRVGRPNLSRGPPEGGVQTSRTRTLLLLLRAGHVAAVLRGHCSRLRTALLLFPALAGPREGERPKLRTSKAITIVLFVLAVSV
jgi:hypothetical protein